jgi:hypothetical protein
MAVSLTLGSVVFSGFEIPQEIPFGGSQQLVVKKLVGGDRVIDAMGRDDIEIEWSGRFRGSLGEARARELDLMRIQGQQQLLAWSSLRFLVVVEKFKANFQQPFEIPYSISCTIITDLSAPINPAAIDADSAINSDLNAAGILGAGLGVAQITQALTGVATAAALVQRFQGASVVQISGVQTAIATARGVVTAQAVNQNTVVAASGSVAGMVGGTAPQQLAQTLSTQASAFGQLGQLYQLNAVLGRSSINIANAGG